MIADERLAKIRGLLGLIERRNGMTSDEAWQLRYYCRDLLREVDDAAFERRMERGRRWLTATR